MSSAPVSRQRRPHRPGPTTRSPSRAATRGEGRPASNHSPSARAIDWNRANDLGAPTTATAPGVVSKVVNLGSRSYGRYIVLDHGNGRTSLYAHLVSQWVSVGQAVDQGFVIGQVGTSGGSTGPHLHFEQRLNGTVQTSYFHRAAWVMGSTAASQSCGDTPIAGNFDGVGADNPGILRRGATPTFVLKRPGRARLTVSFGRPTDEAMTGDWNGDGVTDVGVRRAGAKAFLLRDADGSSSTISLGAVSDVGVTGDWNGDDKTDVGVWSPASRVFTLRAVQRHDPDRHARLGRETVRSPGTGTATASPTSACGAPATPASRCGPRRGPAPSARAPWPGAPAPTCP